MISGKRGKGEWDKGSTGTQDGPLLAFLHQLERDSLLPWLDAFLLGFPKNRGGKSKLVKK